MEAVVGKSEGMAGRMCMISREGLKLRKVAGEGGDEGVSRLEI